jgi:hypothetical protein
MKKNFKGISMLLLIVVMVTGILGDVQRITAQRLITTEPQE